MSTLLRVMGIGGSKFKRKACETIGHQMDQREIPFEIDQWPKTSRAQLPTRILLVSCSRCNSNDLRVEFRNGDEPYDTSIMVNASEQKNEVGK